MPLNFGWVSLDGRILVARDRDLFLDSVAVRHPRRVTASQWYPSLDYPCAISCSETQPAKLYSVHGQHLASYVSMDQFDEPWSPHEVAFHNGMVLCGLRDAVDMFDVSRPGKEYVRCMLRASKRSNGQHGIVSRIACRGQYMAVGTFARSVGLYDMRTLEAISVLNVPQGISDLVWWENELLVVCRKHNAIFSIDLATYTTRAVFERHQPTNQRQFIALRDNALCVGDAHGTVHIHDMRTKTTTHHKVCTEPVHVVQNMPDNRSLFVCYGDRDSDAAGCTVLNVE